MDWAQFGWNATVAIIGSGLGTTSVGLLFKRQFDRKLEIQKAFLTRASRVHERTVDTLTKLYRHFHEAQALLQLMAATARFEGEKPEEYPRLFSEAIASARDELSQGRLLMPPDLVRECDRFFTVLFAGCSHLAFANHPMIFDGLQRAKYWDSAKQTAYEEVPKLLEQIERTARVVIHGNLTGKEF